MNVFCPKPLHQGRLMGCIAPAHTRTDLPCTAPTSKPAGPLARKPPGGHSDNPPWLRPRAGARLPTWPGLGKLGPRRKPGQFQYLRHRQKRICGVVPLGLFWGWRLWYLCVFAGHGRTVRFLCKLLCKALTPPSQGVPGHARATWVETMPSLPLCYCVGLWRSGTAWQLLSPVPSLTLYMLAPIRYPGVKP
jgi:hypothetical protein